MVELQSNQKSSKMPNYFDRSQYHQPRAKSVVFGDSGRVISAQLRKKRLTHEENLTSQDTEAEINKALCIHINFSLING
jgi:hypothetical protein